MVKQTFYLFWESWETIRRSCFYLLIILPSKTEICCVFSVGLSYCLQLLNSKRVEILMILANPFSEEDTFGAIILFYIDSYLKT